VAEKDSVVPEKRGVGADARAAGPEALAGRTTRLEKRLKALERRPQQQPEPNSPLKLMTTRELRLVLSLVEQGRVLPSGEVRRPEVFRSPPPEELEALERWRQLCGEPLDHLEAAEELLDRVGEAHGWYAREAVHAALLLTRLELPDASAWFVSKRAEAVLNLYAELEEHHNEQRHPHVRGAVGRLERLKGMMGRLAREPEPIPQSAAEARSDPSPQRSGAGPQNSSERVSWWRRMFGE
jgi:hypothetical protein